MRRHQHQRAKDDRGSLTLSYAIAVPLAFAALMLIVQAAWYGLAWQAALAAARHGADAARVLGATPGAASSAAVGFAAASAFGFLRDPHATVSVSNQTVQVTVKGQVWPVLPGLVLPVSQTVQAPAEHFTTP